jgi:hypothetical protein
MASALFMGGGGIERVPSGGKGGGGAGHAIIITRPTLFEHGILPVPTAMPTATQLCEMVGRFGGGGGGRAAGGEGEKMGISTWHKIAKETIKMDTGFAQLVFDIFLDCTTTELVGAVTEVDAVEFAIYLLLLSNSKEEIGIGGSPRALRADIAYPQLNAASEGTLSPRSQPKSPRTVLASGSRGVDMERRQASPRPKDHVQFRLWRRVSRNVNPCHALFPPSPIRRGQARSCDLHWARDRSRSHQSASSLGQISFVHKHTKELLLICAGLPPTPPLPATPLPPALPPSRVIPV